MSDIAFFTSRLRDAQKAIADMELAFSANEPTPAILLTLQSLKKQEENLQRQFEEAASLEHLDVCDYRLFIDESDKEKPTLRAFTKALLHFQNLFTQVYAAIKGNAPRETARVSAEFAEETAFGVHYVYEGSLGVVLTLPNERLLFGETDIDNAMKVVFDLIKAKDSEGIADYAKQLGAATIRALYSWTNDQVKSGLGSQIQWKRNNTVRLGSFVQLPELTYLRDIIEATSDEVIKEIELKGTLVGLDVKLKSFHLSFEQGDDIRGVLDESLVRARFNLPKFCKVKLIKTTTIKYSTDKEVTQYVLKELIEIE